MINHRLQFVLMLFTLSLAIAGCSLTPIQKNSFSSDIQNNGKQTLMTLNQQYREWRSVRYHLGGLSKKGIDCSGFVYLTFRDKFGLSLPMTTEKQYSSSKKIKKGNLKAGDLVFFKTGFKQKHVGIYLSGNKFLHASTSKGVMISNMGNPYWKKHFLNARRI